MHRNQLAIPLAAALVALSGKALAQTYTCVAMSGPTQYLPAPLTANTFESFDPPYINNAGKVVFHGWSDGPCVHGDGIFTWDSSVGTVIVAHRDPAPDAPCQSLFPYTYKIFSAWAAINDSGTVAFTAYTSDVGHSGVFYGTAYNNVQSVVICDASSTTGVAALDENLAACSPPLHFSGVCYSFPASASRLAQINNAGDIIFEADTAPDGSTSGGPHGWWFLEHGTTTPRNIVREGMTLPADPSCTTPPPGACFPGGTATGLSHADLSDNGSVAFIGNVRTDLGHGSFVDWHALFRGNPTTSLSSRFVFGSGSTVTTQAYCQTPSFNTLALPWVAGPYLRDESKVGLQWYLGNNLAFSPAVFRFPAIAPIFGQPNSLDVMTATDALGMSYPALNKTSTAISTVHRTPSKEEPFENDSAMIYCPGTSSVNGPGFPSFRPTACPNYYIALEGHVAQCVHQASGDPTWLWSDFQIGNTFPPEDTYTMRQDINNNNQIAFLAGIKGDPNGPSAAPQEILYAMDLRFNRRYEVARTGGTIPGVPGVTIATLGFGRPNGEIIRDNPESGMCTINDCGKVAFMATFSNGESGIFIWQMPLPANVDGSTTAPTVNANDFQHFINAYAANDLCNCDFDGTGERTANDFQHFLNAYAIGSPEGCK